MSMEPVAIALEFTPNPNTLKYVVNRQLLPAGAEYFRSRAEAEGWSPVAVALFDLGNVAAVTIGPGFVAVTVSEHKELRELHQRILASIRQYLDAGGELCRPRPRQEGTDDPLTQRIRSLLDQEIRPMVAMDGGDIAFERFADGVVYLYLQGACAGCPGAAMTLKLGVEARLQQVIPEVREVVALPN